MTAKLTVKSAAHCLVLGSAFDLGAYACCPSPALPASLLLPGLPEAAGSQAKSLILSCYNCRMPYVHNMLAVPTFQIVSFWFDVIVVIALQPEWSYTPAIKGRCHAEVKLVAVSCITSSEHGNLLS